MFLRPSLCTGVLALAGALWCYGDLAAAAGSSTEANASQAEVQRWIAQLGDEDFGVREAATNALIPNARACWASLQAAGRSKEAEVRERALKILEYCYQERLKVLLLRERVLLEYARAETRALMTPLVAKFRGFEQACDGYQARVNAVETEFERARTSVQYRVRAAIAVERSLGELTESERTEDMKKRLAAAKAAIAEADREIDVLKAGLKAKREELDRSKAADEAAKADAFETLKRMRIERAVQEAVLGSRINQMDEAMDESTGDLLLNLPAPPEAWDPNALPWGRRMNAPLFVPGVCATVRLTARIFEGTTGIPVEVSGKQRTDCGLEPDRANPRAFLADPGSGGQPAARLGRAERFFNDIAALRGVTVEIDAENARVRVEIQDAE